MIDQLKKDIARMTELSRASGELCERLLQSSNPKNHDPEKHALLSLKFNKTNDELNALKAKWGV